MTRGSINTANIALLRVLGLDPTGVTQVDIAIRHADLPRLQITKVILSDTITETRQLFELRALGSAVTVPPATPEPAPLDLDAMCRAAMGAVTESVERAAFFAREGIKMDFARARVHFGIEQNTAVQQFASFANNIGRLFSGVDLFYGSVGGPTSSHWQGGAA